ncbi:MAG: 3'-5' exonuclease, partial [Eubacteriales bacterium]|nr:3'-5' exonuclease [Eubacteriales bacterium]
RMNALSRNIEYALRESNINYHIYGGTRFYDRREIKDVTAYLRLIMTPEDDVAFRRAVQVPRRGIGEVTIERINALAGANNVSMLDISRNAAAYEDLSRVAGRVAGFAQLIDALRAKLEHAEDNMTLADFISLVENRSGMVAALQEEAERGNAEAPSRLENLQELLSDALEFEANLLREDEEGAFEDPFYEEEEQEITPLTILQSFLERTALFTDQDTEDEEPLVSLMTVHSAKGLEFDVVYLVGAEEGIFPSSRCFESPDGLEEERRLAYVAVTRAKKELIVTMAANRLLFGSTQYNMPSRFIESIPEDLVERRGTAAQKRDYSSAGRVRTEGNLFASSVASGKSERIEKSSEKAGGLDPQDLHVGDKIRHASFGVGEIKKINTVGKDAILTIDFAGVVKRYMASQSFLTKE